MKPAEDDDSLTTLGRSSSHEISVPSSVPSPATQTLNVLTQGDTSIRSAPPELDSQQSDLPETQALKDLLLQRKIKKKQHPQKQEQSNKAKCERKDSKENAGDNNNSTRNDKKEERDHIRNSIKKGSFSNAQKKQSKSSKEDESKSVTDDVAKEEKKVMSQIKQKKEDFSQPSEDDTESKASFTLAASIDFDNLDKVVVPSCKPCYAGSGKTHCKLCPKSEFFSKKELALCVEGFKKDCPRCLDEYLRSCHSSSLHGLDCPRHPKRRKAAAKAKAKAEAQLKAESEESEEDSDQDDSIGDLEKVVIPGCGACSRQTKTGHLRFCPKASDFKRDLLVSLLQGIKVKCKTCEDDFHTGRNNKRAHSSLCPRRRPSLSGKRNRGQPSTDSLIDQDQRRRLGRPRKRIDDLTPPYCPCNGVDNSNNIQHSRLCPEYPKFNKSYRDKIVECANSGCERCRTDYLNGMIFARGLSRRPNCPFVPLSRMDEFNRKSLMEKKSPSRADLQDTTGEPKTRDGSRQDGSKRASRSAQKPQHEEEEMPFCMACKDPSYVAHSTLCPLHPQFENSGAREKLEKLRFGIKVGCEACKLQFSTGKAPSNMVAHNAACIEARKPQRTAKEDKDERKNRKTEDPSSDNDSVPTVTPIPRKPSASSSEKNDERMEAWRRVNGGVKPKWKSAENPWGKDGYEEGDVSLSHTLGVTDPEVTEPNQRFNLIPFADGSTYHETHRSPDYQVLVLTRDRLASLPWGFEVGFHEFGGACLVTAVDKHSPAAEAALLGTTMRAALRTHDMILSVNGKKVGGLKRLSVRVELERSATEMQLVVSRYRFPEVAKAERAKKEKMAWDKIGAELNDNRRLGWSELHSDVASKESALPDLVEDRTIVGKSAFKTPTKSPPVTPKRRKQGEEEDDHWDKTEEPENGCVCGDIHEDGENMFWIQCDDCEAWYDVSPKCVGFDEDEAQKLHDFSCWACGGGPERKKKRQKIEMIYELNDIVKVNDEAVAQGGVGRIIKKTANPKQQNRFLYDVRYILGGKAIGVSGDVIEPHNWDGGSRRTSGSISPV